MKPIRSRDELLWLCVQYAPTKACRRAISEGRAQVLGGFTAPKGLPTLIVRVRSEYDRVWLIGVEIDEPRMRQRIVYLDEIPWATWDGRIGGKRPLIDGDDPTAWAFEKMQRRKRG